MQPRKVPVQRVRQVHPDRQRPPQLWRRIGERVVGEVMLDCTWALIDVTSDSTSMSSIASRRTLTLTGHARRPRTAARARAGAAARTPRRARPPNDPRPSRLRGRRQKLDGSRVRDRRHGEPYQPRLHAHPPQLVRGPVFGSLPHLGPLVKRRGTACRSLVPRQLPLCCGHPRCVWHFRSRSRAFAMCPGAQRSQQLAQISRAYLSFAVPRYQPGASQQQSYVSLFVCVSFRCRRPFQLRDVSQGSMSSHG